MLVDELVIPMRAGNGGDGVVRWRREKHVPRGGPAGGNGGRGGDLVVRAVRDISLLASYRHIKEFVAEDGISGDKMSKQGRNGEHKIVNLPVGTKITLVDLGRSYELSEEGQEVVILHGGRGGLGNEMFKSSTNQVPAQFTEGKNGEASVVKLELKLIADVGLVGFPNAGKSSLLNSITNATSKVGQYKFTTLEPHLGALHEYVIADIPGIIEGASEGKGLGIKFLKHIERTKMLLYCIPCDSDDVFSELSILQNELYSFSEEFRSKNFRVLFTKTDILDSEMLDDLVSKAQKQGIDALTLSVLDDNSIKLFSDTLVKILRSIEHKFPQVEEEMHSY